MRCGGSRNKVQCLSKIITGSSQSSEIKVSASRQYEFWEIGFVNKRRG